jgi:MFS family permease
VNDVLVLVAVVCAGAAAVRSTWSPCGLSMLSTITPLGERGRGHRFGSTAAWFVGGAVLGGACLGAVMAGLAAVVAGFSPQPDVTALLALGAGVVAAASDLHLGGFGLPVHHRQVNERWLDGYRSWVYGAGFGFQIGTGLLTYITTAAVYLTVVLGALSGRPLAAFVVGTLFGLVRGLAVFGARRVTDTDGLRRVHRRLAELAPASRLLVVVVELGVAVAAATAVAPLLGLGTAAGVALVLATRRRLVAPALAPVRRRS